MVGGMNTAIPETKQGSSGSSAGSASATAAGCVAFAIGSETLGINFVSIDPLRYNGLRPTFGFVRAPAPWHSPWTMDKLGPLCRAVEDSGDCVERDPRA